MTQSQRLFLIPTTGAKPVLKQAVDGKVETQNTTASRTLHSVYVDRLNTAGREVQLREPIAVKFLQQCDLSWEASIPKLCIFVAADSQEEAMEEVAFDFIAAWDGLASEPDDRLTADAQVLKKTLRHLVK